MREKILCLLLVFILFLCGCRKDSKESLESRGYQINKKITGVLKSINDNDSAKKAIPKIKDLMTNLQENTKKLAKFHNNNIDISSEYGIRIFQHKMQEQFPALQKLYDKGVSSELVEEIFNTMTSGGYFKAKELSGSQTTDKISLD